jgi:hypothetical protein
MLVRKAVAAASITTLMTAGLGLATAAPASAAPSLSQQISQDLGRTLPRLSDVDLVVIDIGGQLINVQVDDLTVVALNNVVVEILNNVDVDIRDINVDVNIEDNVVFVDVL